MDLSLERDSTAIGSLFQQIIGDMKNTSPLWEDFVAKASKLHTCLRAAIQAIAAYLDAFQKIADAATNSRGASKEIGTALTRVCLRHKAVETRMKTFSSAIMDCLIIPLQDKLEDWKRQVATLDKEHAKEHKRCRTELKKRSSDTLRLQKKARKGQSDTIQSLVDSHMQDVTQRRVELEEVERKSLRSAMIEERMRYCSFVNMLQPVVKEEIEVMSELGHLQEAMESIAIVTKEPNVLPQSSEELILESKTNLNLYPESPGGNSGSQGCSNSLGSRKSSVCSISSMNSSGSSGSPGHHHYPRSLSQLLPPTIRLKPGESSDSGFCSSPALTSQASTATSQSHAVSTWPPHSQDVQTTDRPHTISTAYEKGHQRPALTVYTFQNPETIMESQKSPAAIPCRPPLPVRCSSLERPLSSTTGVNRNNNSNLAQRQCPSPIPAHIAKEHPQFQPTYVNMSELASMATTKITNQQQQQQQQQLLLQQLQQQQQLIQQQQQQSQLNSPNSIQSNTSSQISSDSSITTLSGHQQQTISSSDLSASGVGQHSGISSTTITTTATAGTTPSSGGGSPASTPQNNSPFLINNPNSPAQTASNNSIVVGGGAFGHQKNVCTGDCSNNKQITCSCTIITPIHNTITSINTGTEESGELKITETDCTSSRNKNLSPAVSGASSVAAAVIENDKSSRGSVLEKKSLFEKLEQKQQIINNNLPLLINSRSGHNNSNSNIAISSSPLVNNICNDNVIAGGVIGRRDEIYKAASQTNLNDAESDQNQVYEDAIAELNKLIGNLDSFQREHEIKEQLKNQHQQEQPLQQQQFLEQKSQHEQTQQQKSNADTDSDKISIGSLNYSTQSTNASDPKFNYSDSEISRYMSETSSLQGFENPTFAHLNSHDEIDSILNNKSSLRHANSQHSQSLQQIESIDDSDSGSHVIIYDDNYVITPDMHFLKENSEIVVLRCKDVTSLTMSEANATAEKCNDEPKQRLSSFRTDQQQNNVQAQQQQQHRQPPQHQQQGMMAYSKESSMKNTTNLLKSNFGKSTSSKSIETNLTCPPSNRIKPKKLNSVIVAAADAIPTIVVNETAAVEKPQTHRLKPIITPRPASLSGCVSRITRRSSVNSTKPPPPVRRSSSVTPSHNVGCAPNSPNLIQQNMMNASAESLPPPPAYLLDRSGNNASPLTINVAETVKALTVIRHMPASPSVLRRAQNQANQASSMVQNHHATHYTNNQINQNAAFLPIPPPDEDVQQSLLSPYLQQNSTINASTQLNNASDNINSSFRTTTSSPSGIYAQPKQVSKMSSFRSPSPGPNKTSSGLLAQLNARLSSSKQSQNSPQHHGQHQQTNSSSIQPVIDYGNYQQSPHQQDNRNQSIPYNIQQSNYSSAHNSPHHHSHQNAQQASEQNYSRSADRYYYGNQQQQQQQQHQQHQQFDDFSTPINEKTGSIRSKTKAEFLENLNAKLAKQGLSGRAFAVRSLINSKALLNESFSRLPVRERSVEPDPRLCHESLMDQIKRGANLKRNRTINDRSAPKIH